MCQPKPGPRCSGHARTVLTSRRAERDQAAAARDEAQAALRATARVGRNVETPERETARKASIAADRAYYDACAAYEAALRDYETTPDGMNDLEQAIVRLAEEGHAVPVQQAQARLEEARATRTAQIADLAMARRFRERLANATEEEKAAIAAADDDLTAAEEALAEASAAVQNVRDMEQSQLAAIKEMTREENAAHHAIRVAHQEARDALDDARAQAVRLYTAAGISERMAAYYAADMAEATTRPERGASRYRNRVNDDDTPLRAMTVKVKRDGPDHDKTLAAKAASETDAGFQAANQRLTEAIAGIAESKSAAADVARRYASVRNERQSILGAASHARYAVEDAEARVLKAKAAADETRARVAANLHGTDIHPVPIRDAADAVMRNPDGTTNAHIREAPSPGFPHGRYIPVEGVTTVQGMGPANAMVLENGRKAWLHEHYANHGIARATTRSNGVTEVHVTSAHEGAIPLRHENVANAGYTTFVDSTD